MQTELVVVPREVKGKKAAKKLRKEGRFPAVVYGHGFESMLLSVNELEFMALLRQAGGVHGLLNLKVEGLEDGEHTVVVKEIQRHPIKDYILHVDFQKIRKGEEMTTEIALHFTGEPVGVKAGGILQHNLYEITVKCLPKDLPESIDLDISHLDIKDNLRVGELAQFEGVEYLNSPEEVVVAVVPKRLKEEIEEEVPEELELEEGEVPEEEAAEGEEAEAASEKEEKKTE
jgi:large subunit ribosomal protein L25